MRFFGPCLLQTLPHNKSLSLSRSFLEGDGSWSTIKLVLGWILDTESLTIRLPPHCVERLWEILDKIPPTQRWISIRKWRKVLGELRSMSLALPGLRNIFSTMQNALALKTGGHLALDKGVHHALKDFPWMQESISTHPTWIAEVVPLPPVAKGHHDASGLGAGGIWFPGPHHAPCTGFTSTQPLVWWHQWPEFISSWLVMAENPHGSITNSDLELAGGLLHLDTLSQCFFIWERTVLSKGDNLSTTFWERWGSTSTNSPPAYLLHLFGMHQYFHRYVPRFDYISGPSNPIADSLSCNFDLNWSDQLANIMPFLPQHNGPQVWTPSGQVVSAVTSALLRKQSRRESLQVVPPVPLPLGTSGVTSPVTWALTPFSKPSRTKYHSYKSLPSKFVVENYLPAAVRSGLDWLKITYGTLPRHSLTWGPRIPG
jgi:hypothetical protein